MLMMLNKLNGLLKDHYFTSWCLYTGGFPGGSDSEESAWNAGDLGSIPGLERSPEEGKGYPLQYSPLKKTMNGGAWWATIHGAAKSQI